MGTAGIPPDPGAQPVSRRHGALVAPLVVYYLTSLAVMLAAVFGDELVYPRQRPRVTEHLGKLSPCAAWDGEWYVEIVRDGYSFDPDRTSSVQFFPVYPLLGRTVMTLFGFGADAALLVVAHAALFGAFVLLATYVRQRFPEASGDVRPWTLAAFGLSPNTFYLRMAYSESLFVFLVLLVMYGIERRWSTVVLALLAGTASATRPVGIALIVPLAIHVWQTSPQWRGRVARLVTVIPLSVWGIVAYMVYQQMAFANALAFIQTRTHWQQRDPAPDMGILFQRLLSLEPIRSVYDHTSPCYWGNWAPEDNAFFSVRFDNPIFFIGSLALLAIGALRRWLNGKEVSLGAVLLLIPYMINGDKGCMMCSARFAAVVFPVYMVIGRLLARSPRYLSTVAAAICAIFLGAYTALFVSWYSCY